MTTGLASRALAMATRAVRRIATGAIRLGTWLWHPEDRTAMIALIGGLAFGAYFVLRYGGLWGENDSAFFVFAANGVKVAGPLHPENAYTHGFAYPLWAAILSNTTGLSVGELFRVYTPLVGNLFLGIFGYALFRRLLGSKLVSAVATLSLYLVAELYFTVSRGNHEKLLVALMLLIALAIVRTIQESRVPGRWGAFIGWLVVYYASAFVLFSINVVLASAVTLAWFGAWLLLQATAAAQPRQRGHFRRAATRIALVTGSFWLLGFGAAYFVYPPALGDVSHAVSSVRAVLNVAKDQQVASNPYAARDYPAWVSREVYVMLTVFRWVLLAGSAATWLVLAYRAWVRPRRSDRMIIVLLGLYAAMGLEVVGGVAVDFAGVQLGNNLQVRLFTYFSVLAVPLLTVGLLTLYRAFAARFSRRTAHRVAFTLFGVFAFASLLKATLDPTVANDWIFVRPSELAAITTWTNHTHDDQLRVGDDFRLWYGWVLTHDGDLPNADKLDVGRPDPASSSLLVSRATLAETVAWQSPLSTMELDDRVYDGGFVQIYHRTPQTPFQH